MATQKKSGFVGAIDGLPLVLKIILALPFFDWIVFGLYRIFAARTIIGIIIGLIWIFVGWAIFWILDIIFLILQGRVILVGN